MLSIGYTSRSGIDKPNLPYILSFQSNRFHRIVRKVRPGQRPDRPRIELLLLSW
jgi:hypothetical protein